MPSTRGGSLSPFMRREIGVHRERFPSVCEFRRGNLFTGGAQAEKSGEAVDIMLETSRLRLERIVSVSHATPPGEWYEQSLPEWVVVLQGSAGLLCEGAGEVLELRPGDYVLLPAHLRHRVEWTDPEVDTVWLALHYAP